MPVKVRFTLYIKLVIINIFKKSRIQETKHLSTVADSSTDTKKILLVRQNSPKLTFLCGNFTPFISKSFQIWDHFFPLLFLKDSENLRILDDGLWEVEAKRCLNWVDTWFFTHYEQKLSNLKPLLSILKFLKVLTLDFWKWGQKTVKQSKKHRYQKNLLSKAKLAPFFFVCAAILHH